MPEPLLYLKATGAAAVVSAIFVLAMARVRRFETAWRNAVGVVGMGLGLGAGFYLLSLRLAWPPASGLDRFAVIVLPAALVIEFIAGLRGVDGRVAWILRGSLAAATPRILLHGSVYLKGLDDSWTSWQIYLAIVTSGTLLATSWGLLSWLAARSQSIAIPLSLSVAMICAGLTTMMAGYIKGGAAAFPVAAVLTATAVGTWFISRRAGRQTNAMLRALIGIGVVSLFALLFVGRFYGRLSTGNAVVMLLAPLLCWVCEIALFKRQQRSVVASLRLVFVSIPLVVILVLAKRDFDRDMMPLLGKTPASHVPSFNRS